MIEDSELLREFSENQSERAFSEIVRRHIDLVYSVAYRQVGRDEHLAKDVAQNVFVALAQKAGQLKDRAVLGGWLYRSACFAASDLVRSERRRRSREQEAHEMNIITDSSASEFNWEKLRPILDETISELDALDRDAVLLRYFEDRKFKDIGECLNLSENAARMRVSRALEKLQALAARRGITSTASALAIGLGGQAGFAAPVGLAGVISKLSLATITTAGVAGWTFLNIMSVSKLTGSVAAIVSVAAIGTAVYEFDQLRDVRAEFVHEREAYAKSESRVSELQRKLNALTEAADEAEKDASELLDTIESATNGSSLAKQTPYKRPTDSDANARYKKGQELMAAGNHAAALEEFLWCYDVGMANSGALAGVRNSYLLSSIAELGKSYPEALIALEKRRSNAEEHFTSGGEDSRATIDLFAINRTLGRDAETMRLYDTIAADDPRKAMFGTAVYGKLANAQRYDEAALVRPYRSMFSMFERHVGSGLRAQKIPGTKEEKTVREKMHKKYVVSSTASDIEVLAGIDDIEHASELIARVLEFDSTPETIEVLRTHLTRVGKVDLISDFIE